MKISVASPLSSVLLLFALAVDKAEAQVCGDPGRARFNEGGDRPQGYEGELFSATHCYVEGTYCKSPTLPLEARGSKETIMAYYGNSISSWCTTPVTDFSYAFFQLPTFNEPIRWRVNRARDVQYMFYNASSFNQDITGWDVGNTRSFFGVFAFAESFNQPINDWDVSNGEEFFGMFYGARAFNQPLTNWDTSKGITFGSMFTNATSFNSDISMWNVGEGCLFDLMFYGARSFNQDLNRWGRQLDGKLCDGELPTYMDMFGYSGCESKANPRVTGSFCQLLSTA